MSQQTSEQIEYYGYIIYGKSEDVNKISGKFSLWQ
ncbi:MAG: DUF2000 family protein [Clostridium sp.]|nr:DUF2000 family protein [Clostridium sp.]